MKLKNDTQSGFFLFLNSQFLISISPGIVGDFPPNGGFRCQMLFLFLFYQVQSMPDDFYFCRIFGCMQRFHFAGGYSCQAMNSHCEIIPGTNAFIAEMVDAADYTFIYNGIDGTCQVISISRVPIWSKTTPRLSRSFPRRIIVFTKIIAESGIKPCSTDYDCFLAIIHHVIFSFQFGGAVYGVPDKGRNPPYTGVCSTVKDIIGRYLYHGGSVELCRTCQLFRCFAIQLIG